jgi:hypothetical protein
MGIYFITEINLFDSQPSSNQFNSIMQNEQVYYNLFITMLYPYVDEAIVDYYSEYMTSSPNAAPYSYKLTSIENEYGLSYSYTVEVEVNPYIGPHLTVGKDRIIFKIKLGEVNLEKFEHLESHELPSRYQDTIKKKLP